MNAENVKGLYFAPHFLAISFDLAFIAARCGAAISRALSYEIAPMCSHIFMVLISSVCFIISLLIIIFSFNYCIMDFKDKTLIFQGFFAKILRFLGISSGKNTLFFVNALFLFVSAFLQKSDKDTFFQLFAGKTAIQTAVKTAGKRQ